MGTCKFSCTKKLPRKHIQKQNHTRNRTKIDYKVESVESYLSRRVKNPNLTMRSYAAELKYEGK